MTDRTINLDDISYDVIKDTKTGEIYFAKWASVWEDQDCVDGTIIASYGPISQRDLDEMLGEIKGRLREDQADKVRVAIMDNPENDVDNEAMNSRDWYNLGSSV